MNLKACELLAVSIVGATFTPTTDKQLQDAVLVWGTDSTRAVTLYGDMITWNTASATNMSMLFRGASSFNQAIDSWNTAAVTTMEGMFYSASAFNQAIGTWNMMAVTDMEAMFHGAAAFDQAISEWNTGVVSSMEGMFIYALNFNQAIGAWNTAAVKNMARMFSYAPSFNQAIGTWSTGAVTSMFYMFRVAKAFNQAIGTWSTGVVSSMEGMFHSEVTESTGKFSRTAVFDQAIDSWNTALVEKMEGMFYGASAFNQGVGQWNTVVVKTMEWMFNKASSFNQAIGTWSTGAVTSTSYMFSYASAFNQAIGTWSTMAVTSMAALFNGASFNRAIDLWNTMKVKSMQGMFSGASAFNQAIGRWNMVAVTVMADMFTSALAFNQAISTWSTLGAATMERMFLGAVAFDQAMATWNTVAVETMRSMFQGASVFAQAIGTWNTAAVTDMTRMFHSASSFDHAIGTWNTVKVICMRYMFVFASAFNQAIGTWSTIVVKSMEWMFHGASAFNQAIGTWSTGVVSRMEGMFYGASVFDQAIGSWNTALVEKMEGMFYGASAFNQGIGQWNTLLVKTMEWMFYNASVFDQAIGAWSTMAVFTMAWMFSSASAFNQNIATWNTAAVHFLDFMFYDAPAFNQAMSTWNTALTLRMKKMFSAALAFDQAIGAWNTVEVKTMKEMFSSASAFNQAIGSWNTMEVVTMNQMFYYASIFNQAIGTWSTTSVTSMQGMFSFALAFNQAVGTWNTVSVTTMDDMFLSAAVFNQPIRTWRLSNLESMKNMFMLATACSSEFSPIEMSNATLMQGMMWFSPVRVCPSRLYILIDRSALSLVVLVAGVCYCLLRVKTVARRRRGLLKSLGVAYARARRRSVLRDFASMPVVDLMSDDPMACGRDLHTRVPSRKWCITKDDLDLFEHEVFLAWKQGSIPNGEGAFANAFHDDPSIGPTMYQVNDYFIKPTTAWYGGASFALLLHPEGLDCDCFATHAWSEGIFEFCAKLRRGWPRQCKNMYICSLANPQNLDISALLDVPIQSSPFAQALSHASHMVVVSNRFVSIYSRLWCCYEAYLAYMLNKTIALPKGIVFVRWVNIRICLCMIVMACSLFFARSIHSMCCEGEDRQHVNGFLSTNYSSDSYNTFKHMSIVLSQHDAGEIFGYGSGVCNFIINGKGRLGQSLSLLATGIPGLSGFEAVWNSDRYSVDAIYHDVEDLEGAVFQYILFPMVWEMEPHDNFQCWRTTVRMTLVTLAYDAALVLLIMITKWRAYVHFGASVGIGMHAYLSYALYKYHHNFAVNRLHTSSSFLLSSLFLVFLVCWVINSILLCRTEDSRKETVAELSFSRLTEAKCSDEKDKARIMEVLANRESEVEAALQTLMVHGMSTSEIRHSGSRMDSSAYPKIGLFLVAMLSWPFYFFFLYAYGASFSVINYFHRMHVLTITTAIFSNLFIWHAWLYYDADLGNVVVQAGVLAWIVAGVCGGIVGHWGVVGGASSGICYVAHYRSRIQQTEFQRFLESLSPAIILFTGFLFWESLATWISGSSCVDILQDFFGVCGCVACLGVAVRIASSLRRFERIPTWKANGAVLVGCCAVNCFLTAANLANARMGTFFRADEIPFHKLMTLQGHYTLGITSLVTIGVSGPVWLLLQSRLRARFVAHAALTEIEMQAWDNVGRRAAHVARNK